MNVQFARSTRSFCNQNFFERQLLKTDERPIENGLDPMEAITLKMPPHPTSLLFFFLFTTSIISCVLLFFHSHFKNDLLYACRHFLHTILHELDFTHRMTIKKNHRLFEKCSSLWKKNVEGLNLEFILRYNIRLLY